MKKRKKYVIRYIALGLVLSIIFFSPLFKIKKIEYNVNVNVNEDDFYEYLDIDRGKQLIFFINRDEYIEKIEKHPYIKSAKLLFKYPDTLKFNLDYREEFAVIKYSNYYISIDDELSVLSVSKKRGDIFVIEGFILKDFIIGDSIEVYNENILKNSILLIKLLSKSHIDFKPILKYNDGNLNIELNDAFKAKFGKGDDIERKFNEFVDIYETLTFKGIKSGVIDVSNKGLPLYRPFGE